MLKTRNIGAYRDLMLLFTRYGRKDFRVNVNKDEFLLVETDEGPIEPDVAARAKAFATALKEMGPTYVKFGQLLSTRPDVVPQEYILALESLQDDVEPFSFADVERTVEEELGTRISKPFDTFESTPLAAASLGQVHRALLRDGREVVVKVQRPNVREDVRHDLDVFHDIATELEKHSDIARKMNLVAALEQARMVMLSELNYVQEARNMETLRQNLSVFPQIYIPSVVHDLSTSKILTTELVKGKKVSKLTPLGLIENDYTQLASVLTQAYLKQICVDGVWHSDPHPGNVFVRDAVMTPTAGPVVEAEEGSSAQLVLLDFGMVSRISDEFQDEVIKLLLALSTNRGRDVAEACMRMCEPRERFDATLFTRQISNIVAAVHDADARDINTGRLIFTVIGIANSNDLKAPSELTMLAKTMLHLDAITRKLDPEFDPNETIRDYAEQLMSQKLAQKFHPRNFYPALLDLNQLLIELPHRSREILDHAANGKLAVSIKLSQAEEFLSGMHKIANRITVGVVIAALLVSSSLMMRVETTFRIFGYPGIAVAGYILASAAAFYLVGNIMLRDRKDRENAKFKGR